MAKETVHNAVAVREAYETATELFEAICPAKARNEFYAKAKELAYKSHKDEDDDTIVHDSGMPAKLWQKVLTGVPVEKVMKGMFGDEDAGIKKAAKKEVKKTPLKKDKAGAGQKRK